MRILTVIPARGGSKGIPGKNTIAIQGKPLLAYSIETAVTSGLDGPIVVTSDDRVALDLARTYAGVIALERPPHLAADETPMTPVIAHVLNQFESILPDAILLLQPTSPLREPWHLREAIDLLVDGFNSVISVTEMHDVHPARMYTLLPDGSLAPILAEWEQTRRQKIPAAYYRNGSIYLVRRAAFDDQKTVMARRARAFVMDERYLLNIDGPRDLIIADALIRAWKISERE